MTKTEAVEIIQSRIRKLDDKDIDFAIWKSATLSSLNRIFSASFAQKEKDISKLDIDEAHEKNEILRQARLFLIEYINEIKDFGIEATPTIAVGHTLWDIVSIYIKWLLIIFAVLIAVGVVLLFTNRMNIRFKDGKFSVVFGKPIVEEKAIKIQPDDVYKSNIHIFSEKDELNLSLWRRIPEHVIDSARIVPEVREVTYQFERLDSSKKYFLRNIFTSGLKPEVTCIDCDPEEKYYLNKEDYKSEQDLKKYVFFFDISGIPIKRRISRTFRIITWNSFKNSSEVWAGTLVSYTTDSIELNIVTPYFKPMHNIRFGARSTGEDNDRKIIAPIFHIKDDSTVINFLYPHPDISTTYKLYWEW